MWAGGGQRVSVVHGLSTRPVGLDDPRSPGNTALGAVRKCGSGRSLGPDRQVNSVRGCVDLLADSDLTRTRKRRHRRCTRRRRPMRANLSSGGEQRHAPGRDAGTIPGRSALIRQSQLTKAVRHLSALLRSRQQGIAGEFPQGNSAVDRGFAFGIGGRNAPNRTVGPRGGGSRDRTPNSVAAGTREEVPQASGVQARGGSHGPGTGDRRLRSHGPCIRGQGACGRAGRTHRRSRRDLPRRKRSDALDGLDNEV